MGACLLLLDDVFLEFAIGPAHFANEHRYTIQEAGDEAFAFQRFRGEIDWHKRWRIVERIQVLTDEARFADRGVVIDYQRWDLARRIVCVYRRIRGASSHDFERDTVLQIFLNQHHSDDADIRRSLPS